jgi:hypothetical protein
MGGYADVSLDRADRCRERVRESAEEAVQPGEKLSRVITGEATVRWPPPGAVSGTIAGDAA